MSKDKPNVRENRRKPMLTLKQKRALKRAKRHLFADTMETQMRLQSA